MSKKTDLLVPISRQDHIQGGGGAPITLLEYGDFECPYSVAAYPLIKKIQKELGESLRFVYRNFPLTELHQNAEIAAEAAEAAGAQGKFWEMHRALFEQKGNVGLESVSRLAEDLGLNREKFANDLAGRKFRRNVQSELEGGMRSGVDETPSFFINEMRYAGPWQELLSVIRDVLQERQAG